jgi:hypothetical protein
MKNWPYKRGSLSRGGINLIVFLNFYHGSYISEIWADKRGVLWWVWPDKRGVLWWVWPDKRGVLWWVWPDKRGVLWWVWPDKRGVL